MKIKNKKLFILQMIFLVSYILVVILDCNHVISYVTSAVVKIVIFVLFILLPTIIEVKKGQNHENKKLLSIGIVGIAALLLFSGCSNINAGNTTMTGSGHHYVYDNDKEIAENDGHTISQNNSSIDSSGKVFTTSIEEFSGTLQLAEANVTSDYTTTMYFELNAKAGKIKIVLVKPNSEVEILKEVISNENNKFSGDITINCPAGVNKIKAVGYDYKGNLKMDKGEDVLFTYTKLFGDGFPFDDEKLSNNNWSGNKWYDNKRSDDKWSGKKWHDKKRSDEKFI